MTRTSGPGGLATRSRNRKSREAVSQAAQTCEPLGIRSDQNQERDQNCQSRFAGAPRRLHRPGSTLVREMTSANSAALQTRVGTGSRAGLRRARPTAPGFRSPALGRCAGEAGPCPPKPRSGFAPGSASMNQSVERTAATPVAVLISKCDGWLTTATMARSNPAASDRLTSLPPAAPPGL